MCSVEQIEAEAGLVDLSFDARVVGLMKQAEINEVLSGLAAYKLALYDRSHLQSGVLRLESLGTAWHLGHDSKPMIMVSMWWGTKPGNAVNHSQGWSLTLIWREDLKTLLIEGTCQAQTRRHAPLHLGKGLTVLGQKSFELISDEHIETEGESLSIALKDALRRIEERAPQRMSECQKQMEAADREFLEKQRLSPRLN